MQSSAFIDFRVERVVTDRTWGSIEVLIDDIAVFRRSDYPLSELAEQLGDWAQGVDDEKQCRLFVFQSQDDPRLRGSFRIEPRPTNWQFTSGYELRRGRVLELEHFRHMAACFRARLAAA